MTACVLIVCSEEIAISRDTKIAIRFAALATQAFDFSLLRRKALRNVFRNDGLCWYLHYIVCQPLTKIG